MTITHIATPLPPRAEEKNRITSIAHAPSQTRYASSSFDRVITIFDSANTRRDRFLAKAVEENGKFVITCLAFAPDSTKLAVAQSDGALFVFNLGSDFGDKKSIVNKFLTGSPVTCVNWSGENPVFGCFDGTVKQGVLRTNKSLDLHALSGITVTSVACIPCSSSQVVSHEDGSVFLLGDRPRLIFRGEESVEISCISVDSIAVWSKDEISVIDLNGKVLSTNSAGSIGLGKFRVLCSENVAGSPTVFVACDAGLVVLDKSCRVQKKFHVRDFHPSAMASVGRQIAVGGVAGSLEIFSFSRALSAINLESKTGLEISDVRVHGRYATGQTSQTFLIRDLESGVSSEIQKSGEISGFAINNEIALYQIGVELHALEVGSAESSCTVRPFSVFKETVAVSRSSASDKGKRLAYLIDESTIHVVRVQGGGSVFRYAHSASVRRLEFDFNGERILILDDLGELQLVSKDGRTKKITRNCYFAHFVNAVLIAGIEPNILAIWYSAGSDACTTAEISGRICGVERVNERTVVLAQLEGNLAEYELDENLINFHVFLEHEEFSSAVAILDSLPVTEETRVLWLELADAAATSKSLHVASRAYAGAGDFVKAGLYRKIAKGKKIHADLVGVENLPPQTTDVQIAELLAGSAFTEVGNIYLARRNFHIAARCFAAAAEWEKALHAAAELETHPSPPIPPILKSIDVSLDRLNFRNGQSLLGAQKFQDASSAFERAGAFFEAALAAQQARDQPRVHKLSSRVTDSGQLLKLALNNAEFSEEIWLRSGQWKCLVAFCVSQALDGHLSKLCTTNQQVKETTIEIALSLNSQPGNFNPLALHILGIAGAKEEALVVMERSKDYKGVTRLLEKFPGELQAMLQRISSSAAAEGDFQTAEAALLHAGLWVQATKMHREFSRWPDAKRVAQQYGGRAAWEKVCYAEAIAENQKNGNFTGVDLLISAGLPELACGLAADSKDFQRALAIARSLNHSKVKEVLVKRAMDAETVGNLSAAENDFVEAGKPREAVDMFVSTRNFSDALRVAESHDLESVPVVASALAETLVNEGEVEKALGILERAMHAMSGTPEGVLHSVLNTKGIVSLIESKGWAEDAARAARRLGLKVSGSVKQPEAKSLEISSRSSAPQTASSGPSIDALIRSERLEEAIAASEKDIPGLVVKTLSLQSRKFILVSKFLADARIISGLLNADSSGFSFGLMVQFGLSAVDDCMQTPEPRPYLTDLAVAFSKLAQGEKKLSEVSSFLSLFWSRQEARSFGVSAQTISKMSRSLCRFAGNFIRLDRALFEAGSDARIAGETPTAFVLLNRYLDVVHLIGKATEFPDPEDLSDLEISARPLIIPNFPIYGDVGKAKDLVLDWSVDSGIFPRLPTVQCGRCGTEIPSASLSCSCGFKVDPCCVTGWPLGASKATCENCGASANRDDWQNFVRKVRKCPSCFCAVK